MWVSRVLQEELKQYAITLTQMEENALLEEVHRARIAEKNVNKVGRTRAIGKCYAANVELQARLGGSGEKIYKERFGDADERSPIRQLTQAHRFA